ncbi:MAG: hypothetical protein B7C55_03795 [Actinomycetales bacterium mxb001]|nr:MAG: hypothetical protein B7C55_03795 [Actinomycetales bacterium mxb001]
MRNISHVKRLVDIDDEALAAARAALGTQTIKDTVNQALALAADSSSRVANLAAALDRLAQVDLSDEDRAAAWR